MVRWDKGCRSGGILRMESREGGQHFCVLEESYLAYAGMNLVYSREAGLGSKAGA